MLPSRNKSQALRVYLSATRLCPALASRLPIVELGDGAPAEQCTRWLQQIASQLSGHPLHVELCGALTTLFCMPFSTAMDTPMAVQRMAGGYARHALGDAAPSDYAVIEPLCYGQPALILGLDPSLANLASNQRLQRMEPYAIAAWNRYCNALTEHCWLAVIEPATITLLYKHGGCIHDVFVRRLAPASNGVEEIQTLIRQQFHRPTDAAYVVDEFGLIPVDEPLGSLERISPTQPVFSLLADKLS